LDRCARDSLQHCFVLHRRDFGNTSLVLEIFSASHGRLPVIAKGAKRGKGAAAASLQSFRPLWLSWSGSGEVKTLLRSEPAGRAFELSGITLYCGFYLNELLLRTLGRGDPHAHLFAFYHSALTDLGTGLDVETVLRQFELRLLQELGYAGTLDRDADGQPVSSGCRYIHVPEVGLRPAQTGDVGTSGATLLGLAGGTSLTGELAREARAFMRDLLAPHLGGRPLKSRELFRRWRSTA